jgi:hypothetical protein
MSQFQCLSPKKYFGYQHKDHQRYGLLNGFEGDQREGAA